MKRCFLCPIHHELLVLLVVITSAASSQVRPVEPLALSAESCNADSSRSVQKFPGVQGACGSRLSYLGAYMPDGLFRSSRGSGLQSSAFAAAANVVPAHALRPAEVPPAFRLHPVEHVVDDFLPSFHARCQLKGRTHLSAFLERIVSFAYGRELALLKPTHVTTDSKGRVIVSDRGANAVHVLDGEQSFRIVAGANRRLQRPAGIAVDSSDNIYVADASAGLVLVYDNYGRFLRYIGKLSKDEALFLCPSAIVIDRNAAHLYVADTVRNRVLILDLEGRIVDRIGSSTDDVEFDGPTELAVLNGTLVVLDAGGSRIQVMDTDGHLRSRFTVALRNPQMPVPERGLALDDAGNLYISNLAEPTVKVYSLDGVFLSSFGRFGIRTGEFNSPEGLWIDSASRVYVADSGNRRVQVFQLSRSELRASNEKAVVEVQ